MHHRSPHIVNSIAMLSTISLLVLLVGCGQGSTSNPRQTSKGTASNLGQTSRGTAPLPNKDSLAINADGLHIQSLTGIECPLGSAPGRTPPNWLVLATSRVTYDSGELQQMIGYVKAFYHTDETTYSINRMNVPLPASLLWAAGDSYGCTADLEVTNISSTTIQIPQADVRLTQSPRQNNYQYRLIDTCTLLSLEECECHDCGASGTSCETYYASFHLGIGKGGSVFATTLTANDYYNDQGTPVACGELTLQPSQSTLLIMDFYSLPPPSHLIYSVVPELTLVTSSSQQVLALPQLGSSIAFANKSQFSCYGLQGHTFVLEGPGKPDMHCI